MKVSTGNVSPEEALKLADELEEVIGEVSDGSRKPSRIPLEPLIKLIQYVRNTTPSAKSAVDTTSATKPTKEKK